MKNGLKFLDSDLHIYEPDDLWVKYMPAEMREDAPRGISKFTRDPSIEWRGVQLPKRPPATQQTFAKKVEGQTDRYASDAARGWDNVAQLAAMDKEGIDCAVLYPTRALFAMAFGDMPPRVASAIARAYNDWLFDFCKGDPKRLLGAAVLAPHSIPDAVAEARRAVEELGFTAVVMRPNPIGDVYWHHEAFDPLWTELERLNVPVCFHEGGAGNVPIESTGKRFGGVFMLGHVVSHPLEMMQACVAMCSGGVLERFKKLRVGFLEANCAWVPWLLWRMDEHAEFAGKTGASHLSKPPSAYFKERCVVSVESDEDIAKEAIASLDGENVVFSTDYPHMDSKYPHAADRFFKLGLAAEHNRKILWDNCAKLYGLT